MTKAFKTGRRQGLRCLAIVLWNAFFLRRTKFIVLLEHLGDIIACEPIIRELQAKAPSAKLYWCLRPNYLPIVEGHPGLSGTIVMGCLTEWISARQFLPKSCYLELHIHGRVCPECKIPLHKESCNEEITLDNYYNFGALLPSFAEEAGIKINPATEPRLFLKDTPHPPGRYVVIHRTSNEAVRDWNDTEWIGLISYFNEKCGLTVYDIGNRPLTIDYFHPLYIPLINKTSIVEAANLVRHSYFFVGIDSAFAHVANCYRRNALILLGHYRIFKRYVPYTGYFFQHQQHLLHFDGVLAGLSHKTVIDRVNTLLSSNSGAQQHEHT